jgi:hypothetical protein
MCAVSFLALLTQLIVLNPGMAPSKQTTDGKVQLIRTPNNGIQPQVAVDPAGLIHLIYFTGDARSGDVFYTTSKDGISFTSPLRVNSQPGSAIAIGTIRGAHLSLGKNSRVHVSWMGSEHAQPKAPDGTAPMLYTRMDNTGKAFEPQRNLIQQAPGLDGGGSVASDREGNVYVMWHAPAPGTRGEENRHIWLTRSTNEGKTFTPEVQVTKGTTGVCGCCSMRCYADGQGKLYVLYRSATAKIHRDMYLLTSSDKGLHFKSEFIQPWEVGTCPMSSMFLSEAGRGTLATWETAGQVFFTQIDRETGSHRSPVGPTEAKSAKHPVVATNRNGETMMVWTEGTGWNRGGSVAWQTFDRDGKTTSRKGHNEGVPKWSMVAVFARPDGGWTILY